MIEEAVVKYLTNPMLGDTSNEIRMEARRRIREHCGSNINYGRRPQRQDTDYAITVRRLSTNRDYFLIGESDCAQPIIQFDVFGRGRDSARKTHILAETHLRLSLSGYRGMIDDIYVHGCTIVTDFQLIPDLPADQSDAWTHRWAVDFMFTHDQPVAVETR